MKLHIDEHEMSDAPIEVRRWLAQRFFQVIDSHTTDTSEVYETLADDAADKEVATAPVVEPPKSSKAKKAKVTEESAPEPTAQEVMNKAVEFAKQCGNEALKNTLEKIGAKRVGEIPADKRAAFLAEIATFTELPA